MRLTHCYQRKVGWARPIYFKKKTAADRNSRNWFNKRIINILWGLGFCGNILTVCRYMLSKVDQPIPPAGSGFFLNFSAES